MTSKEFVFGENSIVCPNCHGECNRARYWVAYEVSRVSTTQMTFPGHKTTTSIKFGNPKVVEVSVCLACKRANEASQFVPSLISSVVLIGLGYLVSYLDTAGTINANGGFFFLIIYILGFLSGIVGGISFLASVYPQ